MKDPLCALGPGERCDCDCYFSKTRDAFRDTDELTGNHCTDLVPGSMS